MTIALLGDPIVQFCVLVVIGTFVSRIMLRHQRAGRLIGQIIFFVSLTVLLLYHGIIPYEPSPPQDSVTLRTFTGVAKIIWWVNGAWVLIAFVRLFLIFERKPREGRLLQDLIVGIIYLGAILSIIGDVFSVPIGTLIATSGVFAIILGLALQSTLSDVFSGIALNLGRPYSVGDWIVLENDVQGRVVETNWRATHLLNGTNDLVVIPNSVLAKTRLTNLSSPEESHGATVTVRVQPTTLPRVVADLMQNVLISCNSILKVPEPSVAIISIDGQALELLLSFRVRDMSMTMTAKNEIYDLLYRHSKAAGLKFAGPPGTITVAAEHATETPADQQHGPGTPWRLVSNIPLFSSLTEDEKEHLASHMQRRTYRKDAVIAEQDAKLRALTIVRSGVVSITRREGHRQIELTRLAPGDYFGESGLLMGSGEVGTVRALTFVVTYEIGEDCLSPLLHDRPALAEELGAIMAKRIEAEHHLFASTDVLVNGAPVSSLSSRIKHLFQLQQHD
ncbi:putative transmembrane cyclic nucleotide-binding protein ion channel [Rhizobium freirei PRF 81]|uniref:Putative transmembrane cyclic nucleotide-binding protein ion channel n=1 Tax=Rhizobium freirei PRF 81 TaxID=363754 RepID=N6U4Q5_9HYPH|nr:mechanosensitive ion channel family protein [Rhizobium freirei]ENN87574.1 putative transmembrane cyclic nucleotide-binding protein ion channel [Rhizobium freirei PRF 81]